jgi:hypothetical protein
MPGTVDQSGRWRAVRASSPWMLAFTAFLLVWQFLVPASPGHGEPSVADAVFWGFICLSVGALLPLAVGFALAAGRSLPDGQRGRSWLPSLAFLALVLGVPVALGKLGLPADVLIAIVPVTCLLSVLFSARRLASGATEGEPLDPDDVSGYARDVAPVAKADKRSASS